MKATSIFIILTLIGAYPVAGCAHRPAISPPQGAVGLSLFQRSSRPVVNEVVPESPAVTAGIVPGDTLLAIDGTPTTGLTLSKVVALLRGPRGSDAKLVIQRRGEKVKREIHARRERVIFLAVESVDLSSQTRYIRIRRFNPETPTRVTSAIEPAKDTKTLILDLRSNTGGRLDAAVRTADIFLPQGAEIGSVESPWPKERERFISKNQSPVHFSKIFILVDHNTAAGAELFSSALQSARVAKVVGRQTFGSASVDSLSTSTHTRVLVGRLRGPGGRRIDGIGVRPDIVAPGDVSLVYPPAKDPLVSWLISLAK